MPASPQVGSRAETAATAMGECLHTGLMNKYSVSVRSGSVENTLRIIIFQTEDVSDDVIYSQLCLWTIDTMYMEANTGIRFLTVEEGSYTCGKRN